MYFTYGTPSKERGISVIIELNKKIWQRFFIQTSLSMLSGFIYNDYG